MSLSTDYQRQFAWRSWSKVWNLLPPLAGRVLLDLGCGIGDQAAELVARGASVIGIDGNDDLLQIAQSRGLSNAEFRKGDLSALSDPGVGFDGIWCSFAAAYFPDLSPVLASWRKLLRPRGWIAITEIDDLFGHEPLEARSKSLLEAYAREALAAGQYDFLMGRRLRTHLERSGFHVSNDLTLEDKELAFDGPADAEVVDAWRSRFDRMKLLGDFCGAEFGHVRTDFIGALTRADHRSMAKVHCCIATT